MKCRKGFTRIDLTVTLLCAAFLLVTMGAVGNRGRERAKQLVCASQLAKWGQAIFMHSADNDDMVMSIVGRWGDIPYPHYMAALPLEGYSDPPDDYMRPGEFNVYLIDPYLDIVSDDFENNGQSTRLLACPSCNGDFMKEWVYVIWDEFCRSSYGEYFIEPAYSYWGRADLLEAQEAGPNAKRDLTGATFSSERLLMSEILTVDAGGSDYRYNHGVEGWSWNLFWYSFPLPDGWVPRSDPDQDATGRNQVFGDGRVQWRPISLEYADNLPGQFTNMGAVGFLEDQWNGLGSGWVNRFDVSWY